jgi:hypothetical protein
MKLSAALSMFAIGLGVTTLAATPGCGSTDNGSSGGPASGPGRQPPPVPADATATTGTDERTFAVNALHLGEADRSGTPNKDAWKSYGYNLDGKKTTRDSADVCTRQPGASAATQEDGDDGIDNAFGKTIIPFLQPFAATPSKTITDSIQNEGSFTILFKVKGLTDDAAQSNTGLSGTLLVGAQYKDAEGNDAKPTFSPSDDWPYRAEPQVAIDGAYINEGEFVNGESGATVKLSIFLQGVALELVINKAIITFKHNAGANELAEGTIAGVIGTEELISGIEKVAGRINEQLCGGSTLDSIKQTIRQASDILKDGSNREGVPCDGISIGIGFTAKRVANPTKIAEDEEVPPDPCPQE